MKSKSVWTNIAALCVVLIGSILDYHVIKTAGMYALSGALTNWLAIYMLFERIPFLYGSGIIPKNFHRIKHTIKDIIMNQFFHQDSLSILVRNLVNVNKIDEKIDYDAIYDKFVEIIMTSQYGSVIDSFLGGKEAFIPMKGDIIKELKQYVTQWINTANLSTGDIQKSLDNILDIQLEKLTPDLTKKMMKKIMQKHLGWLVIWGGIFGAIIGALVSLL